MDAKCLRSVCDEDGPKPMVDKKPVQKVDNGADRFSNAHQARYETRERTCSDAVQVVENHNQAHPLLKDELDKRHSVMNITPAKCNVSTLVIPYNDNEKWNKHVQVDRTYYMRRYNNNARKKDTTESRRRKTIVNRSRRLQRKRYKSGRTLGMGICSRCRHLTAVNKAIGTDYSQPASLNFDRLNNEHDDDKRECNRTRSKRDSQSKPKKNKDDALSVGTSGYPDTSHHSFSSYHSFASMDNEPTVDP